MFPKRWFRGFWSWVAEAPIIGYVLLGWGFVLLLIVLFAR